MLTRVMAILSKLCSAMFKTSYGKLCCLCRSLYYTLQIPLTGYMVHILRSTAEATVSLRTVEATMRVLYSFWMHSSSCHIEASENPYSTFNSTIASSSHSSTVSYETHKPVTNLYVCH